MCVARETTHSTRSAVLSLAKSMKICLFDSCVSRRVTRLYDVCAVFCFVLGMEMSFLRNNVYLFQEKRFLSMNSLLSDESFNFLFCFSFCVVLIYRDNSDNFGLFWNSQNAPKIYKTSKSCPL